MSTNQEYNQMVADYNAAVAREARDRLAKEADLIANFTRLASTKGIVLSADSFGYAPTIGIVAKAPGIARTLLGAIKVERDGLLPFSEIARRLPPSPDHEGYFLGPHYMLMANSCYRRQMHPVNNWAPRFIELFWWFSGPGIEKYIALDEDRVRIDVDAPGYFEADTWYGAPFDGDIRNVKQGLVKLCPPLDIEARLASFLFADTYCLDIKWDEANGIKTFQALEIKTERVQMEVEGRRYFPARYLHAEFDLEANHFRHFDGAIQFFTEEEYVLRRDSDFNMPLKTFAHIKARSRKVFKINGSLATKDWVELCCHFYAANPLTFEYFSGAYPEHVREALERIRARDLQGDGNV